MTAYFGDIMKKYTIFKLLILWSILTCVGSNANSSIVFEQFEKEIWVKNAIERTFQSSHVDSYAYSYYAKVFTDKYANLKIQNPDWKAEKLNHEVLEHMYDVKKATLSILNFENDKINDFVPEVFYSAANIVKAFPGESGKIYGTVIEEVTKWGVLGINYGWGNDFQASAMLEGVGEYRDNARSDYQMYSHLYDLGEQFPTSKDAIDAFFASTLKADISTRSTDILSRNYNLKIDQKMIEIFNRLKESPSKEDVMMIKKYFSDHLKSLSTKMTKSRKELGVYIKKLDIRSETQTIITSVENNSNQLSSLSLQYQKEKLSKQRNRTLDLKYRSQSASIYTVSTILKILGEASNDHQLISFSLKGATVAHSILKISKTMDEFKDNSVFAGTGVATAIATGNYISAILSIVNLFSKSGPSADEIILAQIQLIRKELHELKKEMIARFNSLSLQLTGVYKRIDLTLSMIDKKLDRQNIVLAKNHRELIEYLFYLENNMDSIEKVLTFRHFEEIFSEKRKVFAKLNEKVDFCNYYEKRNAVGEIPVDEFNHCLFKFQHFAMNYIDNSHFFNDKMLAQTLKRSSINEKINIFGNIYYNKSVPPIDQWLGGASAYISLLLGHPHYFSSLNHYDISNLIGRGHEIRKTHALLFNDRIQNTKGTFDNLLISDLKIKQATLNSLNSFVLDNVSSVMKFGKGSSTSLPSLDIFEPKQSESIFVGDIPSAINHCTKVDSPDLKQLSLKFYQLVLSSESRIYLGLKNRPLSVCYFNLFNKEKNETIYQLKFFYSYEKGEVILLKVNFKMNRNKLTDLVGDYRLVHEWNVIVNEISDKFKDISPLKKIKKKKSLQFKSFLLNIYESASDNQNEFYLKYINQFILNMKQRFTNELKGHFCKGPTKLFSQDILIIKDAMAEFKNSVFIFQSYLQMINRHFKLSLNQFSYSMLSESLCNMAVGDLFSMLGIWKKSLESDETTKNTLFKEINEMDYSPLFEVDKNLKLLKSLSIRMDKI